MGPIRILQVLDKISQNSGVSAVVTNYYFHMDHARIQFDFLLYEQPKEEWKSKLTEQGAEIYVTGQPGGREIYAYGKAVEQFFAVHQGEYQVVHVHIPNAAFVILRCAKKYDVPVRIVHSHNARGADGVLKKVRNFVLNKWGICYANQYYACGEAAGRYLYGKKKVESGKITILNNAINLEKYYYNKQSREKIRGKLGVSDEILLGHIGRFAEQKNHRGLLEIFAELQKRDIRCRLVLLGDGPLQGEMKEYAMKEGIADKVIFAGVVKNAEEYLSAMDLFVFPSLYEGLPVVCVEAQAAGLPCLVSVDVTREIGLTELVTFMESRDVSKWCDKIETLVRHLPDRNKCLQIDAYDIDKQARRLEEIYLSYGTGTDINVHL